MIEKQIIAHLYIWTILPWVIASIHDINFSDYIGDDVVLYKVSTSVNDKNIKILWDNGIVFP